jgi:hypothetical protein
MDGFVTYDGWSEQPSRRITPKERETCRQKAVYETEGDGKKATSQRIYKCRVCGKYHATTGIVGRINKEKLSQFNAYVKGFKRADRRDPARWNKGPVAHVDERPTHNRRVLGSTPRWPSEEET